MATRTVTGAYVGADGQPLTGQLYFAPVWRLTDPTEQTIVLPVPAVVDLDTAGTFSVDLLTTDSANPAGWVWEVTERVGNTHATWHFDLPADPAPLDLSTAAPAEAPTTGQLQYRGPEGPVGPQGPQGPVGPQGPKGDTGTGVPDTSTAPGEGAVLQLFGPTLTPTWSDNLDTALNRLDALRADVNDLKAGSALDPIIHATPVAYDDSQGSNAGAVVTFAGEYWLAKRDTNPGQSPTTTPGAWLLLSLDDVALKAAHAATKADDVATDMADRFDKVGNLLTLNQATGGDAQGSTTGFYNLNACTIARSTAWAAQGSGSLEMTCTTTGTASAGTTGNSAFDGIPVAVTPGETITALATVRNNSGVSRTAQVQVYFYTSSGAYLSNAGSAVLTGSTSGVTGQLSVVVPATAAYAGVVVTVGTGSANDKVYIDGLSIHKGAAGTFALPGVPVTGQSRIAVNNAVDLSGTSAPEGNTAAPPGSSFLQTSGAPTVTGAMLWRKLTGTGNTGWAPEGALANTGLRNLAAETLLNGWAVQYNVLTIQRIGDRVDFGGILNNQAATANQFYSIPQGFRPISQATRVLAQTTDPAKFSRMEFIGSSASVAAFNTHPAGTYTYFHASWITPSSPWPATLPGTPG